MRTVADVFEYLRARMNDSVEIDMSPEDFADWLDDAETRANFEEPQDQLVIAGEWFGEPPDGWWAP